MPDSPVPSPPPLEAQTVAFYREVLGTLQRQRLPFLVGGGHAFACVTGIHRQTKDLDLFVRRDDYARVEAALSGAGHDAGLVFPHWLGKVRRGDDFVDLIFSSGNGVAEVDDQWFHHALDGEVLGLPVRLAPAEEMLWSKAFIMERERYDGADVAHLLHACAARLDWARLLDRFGRHWRVLLSHLVLFGFIYPGERSLLPPWVVGTLLDRLRQDIGDLPTIPGGGSRRCDGTLLSREQYLADIHEHGYRDGRVVPFGSMTASEIEVWTDAIDGREPAPPGGVAAP